MRRKGPASAPALRGQPAQGPLWERPLHLAPWAVALALVAAVLIDYAPVCTSDADWFRADDHEYMVENKYVNTGLTRENIEWAFTAFHSANWHPLTWISLQLDSELFGEHNPDGSIKRRQNGDP